VACRPKAKSAARKMAATNKTRMANGFFTTDRRVP